MNIFKKIEEERILIFCIGFFGFLLFIVERIIVNICLKNNAYLWFIIFLFFLFVIYYRKPFINYIKRQNIHRQKTWVYYLEKALVWSPLVASFFSFVSNNFVYKTTVFNGYYFYTKDNNLPFFLILVVNIFIFLFFFYYFKNIASRTDLDQKNKYNFKNNSAFDSVGLREDKLKFKKFIPGAVKSIKRLNKDVNVVAVIGDYGSGKSSFVRMLMEKFDNNDILYTYLSLTETNETDDFSKLFVDRWYKTLSDKYLIINTVKISSLLKDILRESNNNFLSALNNLSVCNILCLSKIDRKKGKGKLDTDLSMMFGCIENIKEEYWFFVIDEVDRAKLSEIYRVTEVIERFKIKSQNGFPIKLVFILCFSEKDLGYFLSQFNKSDELALLLESFWIKDKKSVDLQIFVPPVDYDVKKKYIFDLFRQLAKDNKLSVLNVINKKLRIILPDFATGFTEKEDDALGFVFYLLIKESPRYIKRIYDDLSSVYSFLDDKTLYRFSDLLLISYMKIKLPFLLRFFSNTIYNVADYFDTKESNFPVAWLNSEKNKEKKNSIEEYIRNEISMSAEDNSLLDNNKDVINKIMHIIAPCYFNFLLGEDNNYLNQYNSSKSLAYPLFMKCYLQFLANPRLDLRTKYINIFKEHKKLKKIPGLSLHELLDYYEFIEKDKENIEEIKDVMLKLKDELIDNKIKKSFFNNGRTLCWETIYKIALLSLDLVGLSDSLGDPRGVIITVFNCLDDILRAKDVNIELKYYIINSFVNSDIEGSSELHYRFSSAYKKISYYFKDDFENIVKVVMEEYKKYKKQSIYNVEENPTYVLLNSWSGDINNLEEINEIKEIIKNGLQNNEKALELYWNKYPYDEKYENHKHEFISYIKNDHDFNEEIDNGLYFLTLKELCDVTSISDISVELKRKFNFWKHIYNYNQDWCDEKFKLKLDGRINEDTIKGILIKKGIIN